jgi:hypothetical protein
MIADGVCAPASDSALSVLMIYIAAMFVGRFSDATFTTGAGEMAPVLALYCRIDSP